LSLPAGKPADAADALCLVGLPVHLMVKEDIIVALPVAGPVSVRTRRSDLCNWQIVVGSF
jgi:hypothetical protein